MSRNLILFCGRKARRARAFVVGAVLRDFELPLFFRYAVTAVALKAWFPISVLDAGVGRAALDHLDSEQFFSGDAATRALPIHFFCLGSSPANSDLSAIRALCETMHKSTSGPLLSMGNGRRQL